MTPLNLRYWLVAPAGKTFHVNLANPVRIGGPPPLGAAPNGSCTLYNRIVVNQAMNPSGVGERLSITSATHGAPHHGVYLPDVVNHCTRVDTGLANGIVISGRFSGCTFAQCMGGGQLHAGHVYVDGHDPANNPATQARNFEIACGAPANTAVGFQTNGGVLAGAEARGYVIGTFFGGAWEWNWLTTSAADVVINCVVVAPWVPL